MKKKLLFIGDSLTEYYDWVARFPQYEVFNLGISGERVEELYERLPRVVARVPDVDFIFIMTGTNNIAMEDFDILSAYEGIISLMKKGYKASTIVVQSILPMSLYWIDNRQIQVVNGLLKDLSSKYGAEFLDIYSLFIEHTNKANKLLLLEDGVHISDKGYEVWSAAIEKYLREKLFFLLKKDFVSE